MVNISQMTNSSIYSLVFSSFYWFCKLCPCCCLIYWWWNRYLFCFFRWLLLLFIQNSQTFQKKVSSLSTSWWHLWHSLLVQICHLITWWLFHRHLPFLFLSSYTKTYFSPLKDDSNEDKLGWNFGLFDLNRFVNRTNYRIDYMFSLWKVHFTYPLTSSFADIYDTLSGSYSTFLTISLN